MPASPPAPVVPGYRLEELLGRGGSGEVWRAVPRSGGPAVAVKLLVAGDAERQAREAALLGELDHPHLVRLHEVVHGPRRGGQPRVALVLDLLAGGSLAALLARRGRLRPGEVVTALAPVAAALAHAHDRGVVHGDLSPGNVVFTAEGRPVLTDLGVARVLGEEAAREVTPAYVDPTVARGGAPGPASDVFGVAAAAFHALTGVAPWNAATPADTLRVAAEGELPDLAELAPGAPPDLLVVIARGLSADPHDRGSAAAFALDLRHACRPEPVRLPQAGVPDEELARTGRGPRTELTHQVPGRHRRAGDEVLPDRTGLRGRLAASGPLLRRGALPAVAAVVVVVLGVQLGGWWGRAPAPAPVADRAAGAPRTPEPAADPSAAAPTSAAPETSAPPPPVRPPGGSLETTPAPTPEAAAPEVAAPEAAAPEAAATPEDDWQGRLSRLYLRRAEALATGAAPLLDDVYVDGSTLLTADRDSVAALTAAGEALRGFAPEVVSATLVGGTPGAGPVILRVVDRWPDYEVVRAADPGGPALRTVGGRGEAEVRMTIEATAEGWRISSAERVG
ncbi:Serine/threonine protein kinase [Geodermatophilus siccatus]|uniref:non-specific serine/threonine protein kinase n=1 Tax=Geodermatophilus siccatus TaxID=1137991 RepID=A0A1G9USB6_9ACTN|nr:serine/threonine-protein kinase [Geodermatophilus siccatus]SDM62784.1 Serine/threonine protein kinase [Geodermatophilus siccatus]